MKYKPKSKKSQRWWTKSRITAAKTVPLVISKPKYTTWPVNSLKPSSKLRHSQKKSKTQWTCTDGESSKPLTRLPTNLWPKSSPFKNALFSRPKKSKTTNVNSKRKNSSLSPCSKCSNASPQSSKKKWSPFTKTIFSKSNAKS